MYYISPGPGNWQANFQHNPKRTCSTRNERYKHLMDAMKASRVYPRWKLMSPMWFGFILLIVVAYWPATAQTAPLGYGDQPIAMQTRYQFPGAAHASQFQGAVLAGLSSSAAGFPDVLAVVWIQEPAAFFPTWAIQIHSRHGVLPQNFTYAPQPSTPWSSRYVSFNTAAPRWNEAYATQLSYDPGSGAFSLRIEHAKTGAQIMNEQFILGAYDGPIHPVAGYIVPGDQALDQRFQPLPIQSVQRHFIPFTMDWGFVHVNDGVPETTTVTRIDRAFADGLALRLRLPADVTGTVSLRYEQNGHAAPLLTVEAPPADTWVDIPFDTIPLGTSTVTMQYEQAGHVWLAQSKPITVGRVDAHVSLLTFDRDEQHAAGTVTVQGDGPYTSLPVTITADLMPMQWNFQRNRYDTGPPERVVLFDDIVTMTGQPLALPVAIPNPDDDPSLWLARFHFALGTDVTVRTTGAERLFTTYKRPQIQPGDTFAIAVVPDTQYYSYEGPQGGHPDMFIRQMEWIASQAAEENIALMLHMGDITENNRPEQWAVAQKSISLLDGIVPCVLTVGNHDLGEAIGESRHTLLNDYFPPSHVSKQPSFGGSLHDDAMENSYFVFDVAGHPFVVMTLEFLPRDHVLAWANDVAANYPDHRIIVVTHTYMGNNGRPRTAYGPSVDKGITAWGNVNSGAEVWEKFARRHPNVFMILSGHIHHDAVPRQVQRGLGGNSVYSMLFNYQRSTQGGNGWLGMLRFSPDADTIGVSVYSPTLGRYKNDATDGFYVPFCIDTMGQLYRPPNETCMALMQ